MYATGRSWDMLAGAVAASARRDGNTLGAGCRADLKPSARDALAERGGLTS